MNNFDFLRDEPRFAAFAGVAISAERIILIDPDMCILNCRRAMEFAIKWIYSVETSLETPYQDNLHSLLNSEDFRDYVGNDLWRRLDYIRRKGNSVAHNNRRQGFDEAMLCLENLHIFMDFISCCYVRGYEQREFDRNAILNRRENAKKSRENAENAKSQLKEQEELIRQNQEEIERQKIDLKTLAEENADLKEKLSARSQVQRKRYKQHPLDISEFETRKLYIDAMLEDAGWVQGSDWIDEVDVDGVPSRSGNGRVDYVLYDDTQRPLAIIEAKKTCVGVEAGRYQAKEYADSIERKYGRRPVIFLTNGFETHIIDGQYPERKCSCIYSKRDLEKWFNLRSMRTSLRNVTVDKAIAGRYYQEAAIKAVCDAFDQKNRRKALLVMATGSGKTRTVIALCKILINAGWVKNILFLADRNSLVTQAKRSFVNMLPDLSCTNLVEEKNNYNARCVFSTYQTMIGCVDSASDKDGRIFTCGHFDLIICDEAHRSIYNKYKDIFTYFDAPLVGLTATPKDEVDKNTYDIFELANGVPTYGYDLAQAVEDEYLVDYMTIESKVKFLDEGIVYEELSDADKEEYEKTFVTESGDVPDKIESAALNSWLFNKDGLELAHVAGKNDERAKRDLIKRANALSRLTGKHIDEIDCRKEIIDKVLSDSYVDGAGIIEFEEIRTGLRDIMSFIKSTVQTYDTNFDDDILSTDWHESELENDDLKNYKAKAEFYIKQHQDNIVIAKLKTNKPLTTGDVKALEDILWNEIGTRKDYEGEIGDKPLGEFVREIVGLDMNAAKEAFSEYLNETNYDSRQIYFVNQIVEYVVHNGMIKDMSVLMESPFTDRGSITDIFNASVWMGIKKVIDQINANANANVA